MDWHTHINNIHWGGCCLTISLDLKGKDCQITGNPYTTPFYCLKFAPFCGRHSFLCIVAVWWWKNEAYTDWYYSILLLSIIINSVTFVTDFIFAKMERITKLLDKNVYSFILLRARSFLHKQWHHAKIYKIEMKFYSIMQSILHLGKMARTSAKSENPIAFLL